MTGRDGVTFRGDLACVCTHGHGLHHDDAMGTRCTVQGCECREFRVVVEAVPPVTVCPACVLGNGDPVRVRLCVTHRPKGPLTQAQHEAASSALGWLRYMRGDGLPDSVLHVSGHKLGEIIAGLEPLVGAVLQVRAGLPARPDGRRHEQSPGLFGVGVGGSTCGPVECGWCGSRYNAGVTDDGPDGEWVGTAMFGRHEVCDRCFADVESAVLAYIDDILAWYGRILQRRRERDQGKADALRAIVGPVCTCRPPGRRGMLTGTGVRPEPCPVHGGGA